MSAVSYVKSCYDELVHKVSWPTMSELQNSTLVVFVASLIIALIVFVMDIVFGFFIVMQRDRAIDLLSFILGIWILFDGIAKLQIAFNIRGCSLV